MSILPVFLILFVVVPVSIFIGIKVAPYFGDILGGLFVGLIYPNRYFDRPQPMYSIPAAKRAKGLYEEAIIGYLQLAVDYPDELQPYIEVINIAIVDLRDEERARFFLQKGLTDLKNPDDQKTLSLVFETILTRLQPEPEWLTQERARTLVPPDARVRRSMAEPDGWKTQRFHAGGSRQCDGPDASGYVDTRMKICFRKRKQVDPIPRKSKLSQPGK